ncbi:MAG: two-component regulator propeller domain-containing protein [Cyanobacteriota bacterium]
MGFGISLYLPNLRLGISHKTLGLFKRIILTIILTVSIVLSLPANTYAEESNPEFEQITVDEGLSQSGVLTIFQDSQGLIWFGTQDGLNKFDGYNFTVYKYNELNPSSLSDNFILSLYEDRSGTIWVGTQSGGINKFDRKTEQFVHYTNNPDNSNSLGSNIVLSINEDKLGNLWVGTDGGGVNQFNREAEQFTRYTHNPNDPNSLGSNTVLSIYEDQSGRFWIGTDGGGLNQFNRETEQFIHYLHEPNNSNSLSDNTVSSIAEDRLGNLWLTTSSWYGNLYGTALNKFDPKAERFTHYVHDRNDINSLSDNIVISVLLDKSDILWIGTGFSGINKLDIKAPKFIHYRQKPSDHNSLIDNHISSIHEDRNGKLWIGTFNRGLDKFDRKIGHFTHYIHKADNPNTLSNNNIWAVYEDQFSDLWIGTLSGGLNKFDQESGKFNHYTHDSKNSYSLSDDTVWSIYEDREGSLWIGTFKGGLNKFNRETEQFTHYEHNPDNPNSLSDNNVFSIYEDYSGVLWIGTINGGLNKFDRQTEEFTHYQHDPNNPNSLSYDRVLSMLEYPAGTLWLGTYGGGLDKFDIATETFTHYTEKDGLPNNSVVGILSDDEGNLWLSTGKGLSKFNPKTETFRNYDVSDGLQGNEFDGVKAYLKSKTGEMFFGGLNGFNAFYPEQVKDNPHIPPILITDFKIFDKSVKLNTAISETKQIKLSYKDNFFGFEFAALDYTNPQKNQYAYKLEGFDKDWIYSGTRRYATYTNLNGGTYTFRAKGSNNDGVWNEEGTSIKIIITPPPWKTWWAYSLYVVALLCAIYGYVQWKTKTQARENALLRDNERKLNQFLEAIPLGINVIDTVGRVIYTNQTALKIYGRESPSDAPLENCSEIAPQLYISGTKQQYHLEDLPLIRALQGERQTIDDLEIHQSHKSIPVEALGTPIYDEQGNIIYAIVAFQDITLRKQAEAERQEYIEALQQANEQLQAVLDTVPGYVSWINAEGYYLGVNRCLADNFNLSPDAFIGQKLGFLVQNSQGVEFISQFLDSSEQTASKVVDVFSQETPRKYLITIQKYRHNTAAVWVGIDITERVLAEEALRTSLREKEILLQEVHHRVKNNLQIICSLLDLQSQKLSDAKTLEVFRESYNRVRSMALIHEKLYQSTSLEQINFAEYAETLIHYLLQSYKVDADLIKIKVNVEPVCINIDTAIPCGLIINELMSNALKYAFPNQTGGLIELNFNFDNHQKYILSVKDNGIGFYQDFNFEKSTTLGLQLVNVLAQQLDGNIELVQNQGVEFKIKFEVKD